jgi:hypothetical protein
VPAGVPHSGATSGKPTFFGSALKSGYMCVHFLVVVHGADLLHFGNRYVELSRACGGERTQSNV